MKKVFSNLVGDFCEVLFSKGSWCFDYTECYHFGDSFSAGRLMCWAIFAALILSAVVNS